MRAARSVQLVIFIAVVASAMALGAASASAFTLTSSTASKQAGAPTDLSFTYVATGAQALGRLDVDLPPGVVHDPSSTPACPVSLFQTDRCAANTRVATAATTINVAGVNVSVPGAVFHLADAADDADFPLGIVLRPPLSALGLSGKIYLRDRVSFTNGGGLRHSITGPLASVSVLGLPLRSRLSRMSLSFTGRNATGNQTYNSTSCAKQKFTATATFADGRSESQSSPYGTVGCDKLIFVGGVDVGFDAKLTQPQTYTVLLRAPKKAPLGITHEYHRVGVRSDISGIGDWDQSERNGRPGCANADWITNTCAIRSQLGTLSVGIEGFPGVKNGAIYNSFPRGAKPRGRINLRPGVTADFTIDFVTGADGRASLEIDGLPQLPLTDLKVNVDTPMFVAKPKPASCSAREARSVIRGHNGGQTNTTAKYPAIPCPPSVSTVDPRDDDSDGDGFADDELRPEDFQTKIIVTAEGLELETQSARCELESPDPTNPDPTSAVRGKIRVVRDMGSGYFGCEVTEAAGQVTVVFSIASIGGHETVLKRSYTVDSDFPVLESDAPEPMELDSTQFELWFDTYDERLFHPQGGFTVECVIEDSSGQRSTTPGHKYIDTLTLKARGMCQWDTGKSGRFLVEAHVTDSVGHQTVLKRTAVVDTAGPVITLTDPRDQDSDEDGFADDELRPASFTVPFTATQFGRPVDESSLRCELEDVEDPSRVAEGEIKVIKDGSGGLACEVTDTAGAIVVRISAVPRSGSLTIRRVAFTIDVAPPVITASPDNVVYDSSSFDFEFEFTDDTARHPQSKFKAGAEIEIKTGYLTSSAKIVTDRDSGRSKGFARFENVPDGEHEVTLSVEDSTGHVTVLKVAITVDA